jgi:(p)ppGpp synthase/HD superfamily hydrolase
VKGEGGLEMWLTRMREILESSDKEDRDFLDQVRSGLYTDEVFVFTPREIFGNYQPGLLFWISLLIYILI